jgi:hypothetical protein
VTATHSDLVARPLPGLTVELDLSNPLVVVPPLGGLIELSRQHVAPMPERVVALFHDGTEDRGDLLYVESAAARREGDPRPADPAVR